MLFKHIWLISILGTVGASPLLFWREYQFEFLALASLTRDVLSIPAVGACVELLFNSAHDIFHYHLYSFNAIPIQNLMMYTCKSRLYVQEQLAFGREFFHEG